MRCVGDLRSQMMRRTKKKRHLLLVVLVLFIASDSPMRPICGAIRDTLVQDTPLDVEREGGKVTSPYSSLHTN